MYILAPSRGQNYKSETGCAYGHKCDFQHVEADENPSSKSKKGGAKGSVASLKVCTQLGCVSQDSYPRKSFLREENWDQDTPSNSPKVFGTQKIGQERVDREELSRSVNLMSVVLARQNSRKDHMRTPCTKVDAPAE